MFSALSQGSPIYIIDKTDGLKYKTGEVVGVIQNPTFGGAFGTQSFAPNGNVTIKVKVDGNVIDYPEAPLNGSTVSYNNGVTVVCETKQGMITEIENTLQQTNQILADRHKYEKRVKDCEDILKEVNPTFAKDKERDERINSLDGKVTSMEGKLDKILNVLSSNSNNPNLKL
ncbi:MAG: hypothetical protein [crAssphage sp. isolate ctcc615]|uniref:Uncharacterized protein n=1 Tax=crAssphage sp. isolate ctcc615 TaxID=2989853 RepID=A0A345BNY9_9CAUD|nr:MAG: hypothetical protein KNU00_gp71 [crAssphage sp. isolate ctcc615]AXF52160.1 MAG: hypothetical protein [crAssphage sp. isolate ctcc615]